MKCIVVFTLAFVAVCFGQVLEGSLTQYGPGDRFFYFARDDNPDGILELIDSQGPADDLILQEYSRNSLDHTTYFLYTRKNPNLPHVLAFGDLNRLSASHFDGHKNTVFICHGWNSNLETDMNESLKNVFLEDADVNVIVFDWSFLSKRDYITAKRGTSEVGNTLGLFIIWLVTLYPSYDKIHLVGFSLGAHLVGNAGKLTRSRVKRITALDPAGPLWYDDVNRLDETDARYVEVIHTNSGKLGYSRPCGHADFFPNGGRSMPGCLTAVCSHNRAHLYMHASVRYNRMLANECSSLLGAIGLWTCRGTQMLMGNSDLTKHGSGLFRISTRRNYPYA